MVEEEGELLPDLSGRGGQGAEAGRRRLAAAKSGVAALRSKPTTSKVPVLNVSVAEARQFIAQAQNDSRYTLAARKLGEMPDEEVLRLYLQMKRLEDTGNGGGGV